jgi:hypothetical protein
MSFLLDWLVGPVIRVLKDVGPKLGALLLLALVANESAEDAASIDQLATWLT